MFVGRRANIALLALQRRDLRRAKRAPGIHERVVDRPRLPVRLIDGPRNGRRLLQRADLPCRVAAERLRERVARGREFWGRELEQLVDPAIEIGHEDIMVRLTADTTG